MNRDKRLTKREKKALKPRAAAAHDHDVHIHCITCGRHIEPTEFDGANPGAAWLKCQHGSTFPACVEHAELAKERLAEHDRTNQPVKTAGAWH
jgi:hypothetical protein